MRAVLLAAALVLAGCPKPAPPNGVLACGTDNSCPEGYHCSTDGRCYTHTAATDLAMSTADLAGLDLAVDSTRIDACERICTCFMPTCKDIAGAAYPTAAACQADCLGNPNADLACRELHCGFAMAGSPGTHCFHARGLTAPDNSMACK